MNKDINKWYYKPTNGIKIDMNKDINKWSCKPTNFLDDLKRGKKLIESWKMDQPIVISTAVYNYLLSYINNEKQ